MNLFTNLHNPIARHKLYSYIFTHVYISTYNIIYILKLKLILLGQNLGTIF